MFNNRNKWDSHSDEDGEMAMDPRPPAADFLRHTSSMRTRREWDNEDANIVDER